MGCNSLFWKSIANKQSITIFFSQQYAVPLFHVKVEQGCHPSVYTNEKMKVIGQGQRLLLFWILFWICHFTLSACKKGQKKHNHPFNVIFIR